MFLRIECPGCKAILQVEEALAGKQGKCIHCGHRIIVPNQSGVAISAQPLPTSPPPPPVPPPPPPVSGDSCVAAARAVSDRGLARVDGSRAVRPQEKCAPLGVRAGRRRFVRSGRRARQQAQVHRDRRHQSGAIRRLGRELRQTIRAAEAGAATAGIGFRRLWPIGHWARRRWRRSTIRAQGRSARNEPGGFQEALCPLYQRRPAGFADLFGSGLGRRPDRLT